MHVLMVAACPFPVPQGSQVLIRDTIDALQQAGVRVTLLAYGYGASGSVNCRVVRGPRIFGMRRTAAGPSWLKPLADLGLRKTLLQLLRRERFDVVHAHNYEGLWVALGAKGTVPIVYHAHNAMSDELPYYFRLKRLMAVAGRRLDQWLPQHADHVIALHEPLAHYLESCGCRPDRISIIPPSCDATVFSREHSGGESAKTMTVLYTGNLDPYQNLNLLQRAMVRVKATVPQARLLVATSSSQPAAWADHVHLVKDFEDLRALLSYDSVVVCPRISWSGYPMKLLYAMAAGRPVVACRSCAHPIVHMVNGYIAEDDDETSFAEGMLVLLGDCDLRRRIGAEARRTIEEKFHPGLYATKLIHAYELAQRVRSGPVR